MRGIRVRCAHHARQGKTAYSPVNRLWGRVIDSHLILLGGDAIDLLIQGYALWLLRRHDCHSIRGSGCGSGSGFTARSWQNASASTVCTQTDHVSRQSSVRGAARACDSKMMETTQRSTTRWSPGSTQARVMESSEVNPEAPRRRTRRPHKRTLWFLPNRASSLSGWIVLCSCYATVSRERDAQLRVAPG